MRRYQWHLLTAALLLCLLGCFLWPSKHSSAPSSQPPQNTQSVKTAVDAGKANQPKWAEKIENPALKNFFRVTDDIYRGAQPDDEGMKELKKMGIKSIINLRYLHSDKDEIGPIDLKYFPIETRASDIDDSEVEEFLKIVTNKENLPVFVHCHYGSDRTGTMCAIYRIIICGWTKEDALKEMTEGPFGFHEIWKNMPKYIREMDVEAIKKKAFGAQLNK